MRVFDDQTPIYLQMRQEIEKAIIGGRIREDEMVPSTRILSKTHQINQKTAVNALSDLLNENILYKKRGIGIFVSPGSRERLRQKKLREFREDELVSTIKQGKDLGVLKDEIVKAVEKIYKEEGEEK